MVIAESGLRTALLVSQDTKMKLMKRPCIKLVAKQEVKQLLKTFKYATELSSKMEEDKVWTGSLEDYQLVIIDLDHWNTEDWWILPMAIRQAIPCMIVGNPNQISNPIARKILEHHLYKTWFRDGLFCISCGDSFCSVLSMLERYWHSDVINAWKRMMKEFRRTDPEAMKLMLAILQTELDNATGSE